MDHAVISRYSRSFVDVIADKPDPLKILDELKTVVSHLTGQERVVHYFQNPAVLGKDKVATITRIMNDLDVHPELRNLVTVMVENGRFSSLRHIPEATRIELYQRLGMVQVDLKVPKALSEDMRARFARAFEKRTGRKVVLNVTEDASILGGAVARIGSTLIDGSIRTNLLQIRKKLSGDMR